MKKNFKIFGICILIALALQSIVLLFLNYKTFSGFKPNDVTTKLNKKVDKSHDGKNTDKTITVDADAKNITTSYDNSYIAYINKDNKLTYTDMRDNKKKVIEDIEPTMYRWSANNIILVAKNQQERNSYDFYEYNTEKNELNKLQTLRLSDSKGSIEDVKCSPFKTLIFVQAKSFNRDEIYKLNVKNEFDKVDIVTNVIDGMALIPHEDKIVYNTGQSNRFYITYVNKRVYINESGKKVLLGVDNDDRIYIGVEEDSKIKTIYSGRMTENIDAWNKNELKEPIEKENIYVSSSSSYKLDSLKGKITDLNNNKEISYEGTLVSVNNKSLISVLNNEIKLKKID